MNTDPRTDAELNRVIAEWCGWRFVPERDVSFITPAGHAAPEGWTDPEGEPYSIPPNYCANLNAVREALCKLTGDDKSLWYDILALETPDTFIRKGSNVYKDIKDAAWRIDWFIAVEATARQRAEALVRVIEEGKK